MIGTALIQGTEPRNEEKLLEKEQCVRSFPRSRTVDFPRLGSSKSQKYLLQDVKTTDRI